MVSTHDTVDVFIVGGGLIGICLLLALHDSGLRVALLDDKKCEARLTQHPDRRPLALAPASVLLLKQFGLWENIHAECTPIKTIHTSQQGSLGSTLLTEPSPLGYVIATEKLIRHLYQTVIDKKIAILTGTLTHWQTDNDIITYTAEGKDHHVKSTLIVGADGTHSTLRKISQLSTTITRYQQAGIIATLSLKREHAYQAYERFTRNGAIALLPLPDKKMGLVWTLPILEAEQLMSADNALFLKKLQTQFGYRTGRFMGVADRHSYPLQSVTMKTPIAWPLVFIGNAAQTLHPIAGQGFNLGLRDVATLADCIKTNGLGENMLGTYQLRRQGDRHTTEWLTHGLIRLFGLKLPGSRLIRGLSLLGLDQMPLLQQALVRQASGISGLNQAKLRGSLT